MKLEREAFIEIVLEFFNDSNDVEKSFFSDHISMTAFKIDFEFGI